VLDGVSPFVSGWGLIDVVHTAARAGDDEVVWLIVDAEQLRVERLQLVALTRRRRSARASTVSWCLPSRPRGTARREALFTLTYAVRPASRAVALARLGAA
jgi:hypothetical protein